MKYRWLLRSGAAPDTIDQLRQDLNDLPEPLTRALALRGVDDLDAARRFFRPSRDLMHDPFLMADMEAAADRLVRAIREGERVLVYGDYDVDGTTAAALMTHFLRSRGVEADFFIPDRFEDGYGLGPAGIDHAADAGADLIVALDCGITAIEQAGYARERGLDLIICDHHTAGTEIPDAVAVLDPKRPDCAYPFKELSGCGVGFKLVQAALERLGEPAEEAFAYLDLLAVSIASDIVPVHGENRVLLGEGLEALGRTQRPGLRALARAANLDLAQASTQKLVFTIGPRINAAGRLDHARHAVRLLLTEDPEEARRLAQTLETLNNERRDVDRAITKEAKARAERQLTAGPRQSIVLHDPDWHAGVIGIVASRLVETFHRPTIMLCTVGGVLKGSARSITGVNVYNALAECADLLEQFGGHDYAAGMSLREEHLPAFRDRFDAAVQAAITSPDLLLPSIEVDASLSLDEIGALGGRFWAVLRQFGPFGPSNLAPVFHSPSVKVAGTPRTVGKSGDHLKFSVRVPESGDGQSRAATLDVIGFGLGHRLGALRESQRTGTPVELVFNVEKNVYRGRASLQLVAKDVRLDEGKGLASEGGQ